jgi:hypothetical protein
MKLQKYGSDIGKLKSFIEKNIKHATTEVLKTLIKNHLDSILLSTSDSSEVE